MQLASVNPPARNALTLTALAYFPCVLCMMSIGIVVPFIDPLSHYFAASRAQLGLAIALFSVPTAVLATLGGGLIDRYGLKRSMLLAAAISALASVLASQAHSLLAFDCAMMLSGLAFGGTCVAAPCLLIATLRDGARIRAMSFLFDLRPDRLCGRTAARGGFHQR